MLENLYTYLEYMAVITSLMYVWLAARAHISCWWWGLVSVSLYFFIFIDAKLYSEASLQVFYAGMSLYGWWNWHNSSSEDTSALPIRRMRWQQHGQMLGIGIVMAVLLGFFWKSFGADLPFVDATTTAFSILATWMVAKRYLENWLYWIAIDVAGMCIFYYKGLMPTSLLFGIYTGMAIYGWYAWRGKMPTA